MTAIPMPDVTRAAWPTATPQGVELRHLRYFVAVADAGTFTQAAKQMLIAQPTLSQQIRRLEEMVGTPLFVRRREGVRLTAAGRVLLEESRDVLSLVDHGLNRTRQIVGLGRPQLRVAVTPGLPEVIAVETVARLNGAAAAADLEVAWLETALDSEFSLIRQHRADAGLGWLTPLEEALPAPLGAMTLGEFEPEAWIPASHPAAPRRTISLSELARMQVVHGPRRLSAGTYDAWLAVLRSIDPGFEFTDPSFWQSLPVTLAFAATGNQPAAVLTGPRHTTRDLRPTADERMADSHEMVPVRLEQSALRAAVGLVWNGDLPRDLQQVLFETTAEIMH